MSNLYELYLPDDGFLYHQSSSPEKLKNLLWNKCIRGTAHFHTRGAYIPYSGGGIVFSAKRLIARGVKPLWYPTPEGRDELELVEKVTSDWPQFFSPGGRVWEAQWYRGQWQNHKEQEWMKRGRHFCFDWRDVVAVWAGLRGSPGELRKLVPSSLVVFPRPPWER